MAVCAVSVAAFAVYGKKKKTLLVSSISCHHLLIAYFLFPRHYFIDWSVLGLSLVVTVHLWLQLFFFFFLRWFHIFFTYSLVLKVDRNGKPDRPGVQKKQTATREASITMLQSQYEVPSRQREFWGFAQAGIWHCSQTVVLAEWMSQKPMDEALNTFSLIFFSNSHL